MFALNLSPPNAEASRGRKRGGGRRAHRHLEHAGREREPLAQQRAGEAFAVSEVASGRVHGRQLRRFARQQLNLFVFTNKNTHAHTQKHKSTHSHKKKSYPVP